MYIEMSLVTNLPDIIISSLDLKRLATLLGSVSVNDILVSSAWERS
jgi:hypothetical protein